jgi:predicted amidohydrolase YtcJ
VAFGSGAPLDLPDPWAALASATTRQDAAGQPFGGWQPQERITREAALAAMTADGAHAGFADGKIGRLAVGYRADFILVDRDPLMAGPSELRGTRVLETWIGGRRAWAAPATGR